MGTATGLDSLFGPRVIFPDPDSRARYFDLVGLDSHKHRLAKIIDLLVRPESLKDWVSKHHPKARDLIRVVLRRPPLVVLAGDVGSGKTELAETIGDEVARRLGIRVTLFPLSLSARGGGRVGEMTQLLSSAFELVTEESRKLGRRSEQPRGATILLVDEADALVQSREASQMHHEDRAGVNAFIRGVDQIANSDLPIVVIMCTNRVGAFDPAIRRRAAEILTFCRPDESLRFRVLQEPLSQLGLSEGEISAVVKATGARQGRDFGFTFSDLVQRLLPSIVLSAYPDGPVVSRDAIGTAESMVPTSPFTEDE